MRVEVSPWAAQVAAHPLRGGYHPRNAPAQVCAGCVVRGIQTTPPCQ